MAFPSGNERPLVRGSDLLELLKPVEEDDLDLAGESFGPGAFDHDEALAVGMDVVESGPLSSDT